MNNNNKDNDNNDNSDNINKNSGKESLCEILFWGKMLLYINIDAEFQKHEIREKDDIYNNETKDITEKEYCKGVAAGLQLKPNGKSVIKFINACHLATIKYEA